MVLYILNIGGFCITKYIEIWKDLVGYEGWYQISSFGRVKSLDRYVKRKDGVVQFKKGIIKTPKTNSDGYNIITLSKNGYDKTIAIHILVARHFLKNENNLHEVNHKDFNRKNNHVYNLEWVTHQDNILHSKKNGRYKMRNFKGKNNPNYGNHILSDIYKNNPKLAKEKLSRPGSKNGRSVKVELYDEKMNYIDTFDWIGGCAEYLIKNNFTNATIDNIRNNITLAIKNDKKYLKHYYKKPMN